MYVCMYVCMYVLYVCMYVCSETTKWSNIQGSKSPYRCENLKTHKTSWCHMPLLPVT